MKKKYNNFFKKEKHLDFNPINLNTQMDLYINIIYL